MMRSGTREKGRTRKPARATPAPRRMRRRSDGPALGVGKLETGGELSPTGLASKLKPMSLHAAPCLDDVSDGAAPHGLVRPCGCANCFGTSSAQAHWPCLNGKA